MNPYTNELVCERELHDRVAMLNIIDDANNTYRKWRHTTLQQRIDLCTRFVSEFELRSQQFATEITSQMGKPISQSLNEMKGSLHRARRMIDMAPVALADSILKDIDGVERRIVFEPIGPVLVLGPWNYPLMCAVNTIVPAILAGNSVVIKLSDRTPLCAEAFATAFAAAGAPTSLVSVLHASHELVTEVITHPSIAYVAFTGSVQGAHSVYSIAAQRFIDVGIEAGGKDAAFVASDADVLKSADGLVDGALYNAGQSCCSVERAYVHVDVYDSFMEQLHKLFLRYKIGDPMLESTIMGPMASPNAATFLKGQIQHAEGLGAKVLSGGVSCTDSSGRGRFFSPALVTECSHDMALMIEESFGPILGVMKVESDDKALQLVNDSAFGLTGSIWTTDNERADRFCSKIDAGTVFQNRCDFLDPDLPWSGRRDSGKGVSLSQLGFRSLTRTKSYNMRRA